MVNNPLFNDHILKLLTTDSHCNKIIDVIYFLSTSFSSPERDKREEDLAKQLEEAR